LPPDIDAIPERPLPRPVPGQQILRRDGCLPLATDGIFLVRVGGREGLK
jgi:hypothetical protein